MLRRFVILLSLFAFAPLSPPGNAAAASWKPVTVRDLKITAAEIGDAEADAAILFREGTLDDDEIDGTSLRLYIRIKIFNDRGRRYADIQLPYKVELGKITDVEARTIRPDGTPVEVGGRDIFDKLIFKNSNGTHRAKVFSMPAVEPGSIIEYRYRQTYPQGFRYFLLELQSDLFIKQLHYRINPPITSKSDVRWVTFNVQDEKRFQPVWDGTYNVKAENITPFKREPMMPPELTVKMWAWLYYSNELETKPDKYWREYAERMYYRAISEVNPTKTIRRIVETITTASDNPEEKINRIYRYVQSEIQNIGPRDEREEEPNKPPVSHSSFKKNDTADDTIKRRYGTPREINRLFIAMLRAAGFDARVVELTTRDDNFFQKSFADSFQFNSEVTAVVAGDGSLKFYDPGTQYCPFGSLAWEKEAVTGLLYGKKDSRFVETSITEAERNNEDKKLLIKPFADGRVEVQMETKLTGLRALELRSEMTGLTREQQRNRVLAAAKDRLSTAAIDESSVTISDALNTLNSVDSSYKFTLPQMATATEKRLLLKPALLTRRDENFLSATARAHSLYFLYPWSETERQVIETPDGYAIEQLPDPLDIDIGAARYRATFTRDGDRIIYERRLLVNAITFPARQYATVKAFFDQALQADRTFISFKQK
jgi:transglutaminase-like putative cysteine protease